MSVNLPPSLFYNDSSWYEGGDVFDFPWGDPLTLDTPLDLCSPKAPPEMGGASAELKLISFQKNLTEDQIKKIDELFSKHSDSKSINEALKEAFGIALTPYLYWNLRKNFNDKLAAPVARFASRRKDLNKDEREKVEQLFLVYKEGSAEDIQKAMQKMWSITLKHSLIHDLRRDFRDRMGFGLEKEGEFSKSKPISSRKILTQPQMSKLKELCLEYKKERGFSSVREGMWKAFGIVLTERLVVDVSRTLYSKKSVREEEDAPVCSTKKPCLEAKVTRELPTPSAAAPPPMSASLGTGEELREPEVISHLTELTGDQKKEDRMNFGLKRGEGFLEFKTVAYQSDLTEDEKETLREICLAHKEKKRGRVECIRRSMLEACGVRLEYGVISAVCRNLYNRRDIGLEAKAGDSIEEEKEKIRQLILAYSAPSFKAAQSGLN